MDTTHAHPSCADVDVDTWLDLVEAIVADGPADALEALDVLDALDDADDADGTADAADARRVAALLAEAPGAALVRTLGRVDPSTLAPAQALEYLRATERSIAWLSARQADALVAIAGPRLHVTAHAVAGSATVTIEDACRSEVAAATRWSETWAHDRISSARLLRDPLPLTRQALHLGEVSLRHADVVCDAAARLDGYHDWLAHDAAEAATSTDPVTLAAIAEFTAACGRLEQSVLPTARTGSIASARRSAERALARLDADHAARRRRTARASRDVTVVDEGDGHATLVAYLGLEQAHACLAVIDSVARERLRLRSAGTTGDRIGEHRAEALVQLLLGSADSDHPAHPAHPASRATPSARAPIGSAPSATAPSATAPAGGTPIRAHVDIVIDLAALLGLADSPGTMRSGGPGGPVAIAAEVVRQLVADDPESTMRRLVTEPLSGHLLDRGRTTYRIPDRLRDYLVSRDVTCRFPGCHRRADLSQVDHAIPWDRGGRSDRANLGSLCVRHHQLKTHAGWTIVVSRPDGSCRWRSPAGREYERPPGFGPSG